MKKTKKAKAAKKHRSLKSTKAKTKKYFHQNCLKCLGRYTPDHECKPITEAALLASLPEDLRDACLTLRRRASDFGKQRVYNNARTIMFSRDVCYMFLRPKKSFVELCFFLPRTEKNHLIKRTQATGKKKVSHLFNLVHADQVEAPLMDWLKEAYEFSGK